MNFSQVPYGFTGETFFLIILVSIIAWFWIVWLLVASAVKKGVKEANKDLVNLVRKSLELKGVTKEELDKICEIELPKKEVPWYEVNASKNDDSKQNEEPRI